MRELIRWSLVGVLLILSTPSVAEESMADTSTDPYLWLEEVEGEKALAWVREQNERTLGELEADERYEQLYADALEILTSDDRIPYGSLRGKWVYNFWQDEAHVRGLWRRTTKKSYKTDAPEWDVILDFDELAKAEDENWVFQGSNCLEPDRDRCMITLSRGGKDAAVKREFSIAERKFVDDGFVMPEAKSDFSWLDENTAVVSSDWGPGTTTESGYPRIVKLWKRGTPLEKAEVLFEGETKDVGSWGYVIRRPTGNHVFVVRGVTFYENERYYRRPNGKLEKLPLPPKTDMTGVLGRQAIIKIDEDWEYQNKTYKLGSLLAFDLDTSKVEVIFEPTERVVFDGAVVTKSSIVVTLLDNVVSRVKRYKRKGGQWVGRDVPVRDNGNVSVTSATAYADDFLINYEDPVTPDSLYYVSKRNRVKKWKQLRPFYDATGVVVKRGTATSKDGTKVPYFVIAQKDVLDKGPAPTLLYGYGGFQIPVRPGYSSVMGKLWVERGGVYVIASIRGGGEFGPAWHQAALKHHRQRAYDDFHAVAETLIQTKVTTHEKLGIRGGSNGGLLMGVAYTQRPDLYTGVLCLVPLLDMVRYDKLPPGASWVAEYGDPDDPDDLAYIKTYSPYQNLKKDKEYPKVFFLTSTKDDRVHPGHARKMAARMAEYGHPFYYFENIEGGHGAAANQKQRAHELALEITYLNRVLAN